MTHRYDQGRYPVSRTSALIRTASAVHRVEIMKNVSVVIGEHELVPDVVLAKAQPKKIPVTNVQRDGSS